MVNYSFSELSLLKIKTYRADIKRFSISVFEFTKWIDNSNLVFLLPMWVLCSWSSAWLCNSSGIMIYLPFIIIPFIIMPAIPCPLCVQRCYPPYWFSYSSSHWGNLHKWFAMPKNAYIPSLILVVAHLLVLSAFLDLVWCLDWK